MQITSSCLISINDSISARGSLGDRKTQSRVARLLQELRQHSGRDTGLGVGKAMNLEWPDVHLPPAAGAALGYLKVLARHSKNSKTRNVPLTDRAGKVVKNRKPAKAGDVFHRGEGQPIYQTWLNQQHSELRTLLKLPLEFVPHSFRHTYGTRLGESGADAFTIMRLMGHSRVTVSQKYVHPSPETMERAVQRLQALNQGKWGPQASEALGVPAKVTTVSGGQIVERS